MSELERISDLKSQGRSYREIGSILGISHVAVMKRLKKRGNQVVTPKNTGVSTSSKPRKSRVSRESGHTVNQMVTKKTPSMDTGEAVNPSTELVMAPTICSEGCFDGVSGGMVDFVGEIKAFLKKRGIEVYRLKVEGEAYQAQFNGQVVRFYVSGNEKKHS